MSRMSSSATWQVFFSGVESLTSRPSETRRNKIPCVGDDKSDQNPSLVRNPRVGEACAQANGLRDVQYLQTSKVLSPEGAFVLTY